MNYIKQLKADNAAFINAIVEAREELNAFKAHLHSAKFAGTEEDGSRKDWISTGDVLHRLAEIEGLLVKL